MINFIEEIQRHGLKMDLDMSGTDVGFRHGLTEESTMDFGTMIRYTGKENLLIQTVILMTGTL